MYFPQFLLYPSEEITTQYQALGLDAVLETLNPFLIFFFSSKTINNKELDVETIVKLFFYF